jgi:hypothetical protein
MDPLARSLDDIIASRKTERPAKPAPAPRPAKKEHSGAGPIKSGGGGHERIAKTAQPAAQPRLGTKKLYIGKFNKDGACLVLWSAADEVWRRIACYPPQTSATHHAARRRDGSALWVTATFTTQHSRSCCDYGSVHDYLSLFSFCSLIFVLLSLLCTISQPTQMQ